jgi:outer membrane protein OmpA-like peptidoglycan-associated protein
MLRIVGGVLLLLSTGCVQYSGEWRQVSPNLECISVPSGPICRRIAGLATQSDTAMLESSDRTARFRHLADIKGISPPRVEQLTLPPGSVPFIAGDVPVVRVTFDEGVFFDFDRSDPRPEADPVLDLIAENMRRDVPDAALTILGHTDAIGTNEYNIGLSERRAASVMSALARRGVRPEQMSTVAIGKRQPIAPNITPEGRARNRRVEFMVSASLGANLAAVRLRQVPASFFQVQPDQAPRRPADTVEVLRPTTSPGPVQQATTVELSPLGGLHLVPPAPDMPFSGLPGDPITQSEPDVPAALVAPQAEPALVKPTPATPVTIVPPAAIERRPLSEDPAY